MSKYWKVLAVGAIGALALAQPTFAANGGDANHGPKGYSSGTDAEGQWVQQCAEGDATDDENADTIDFVGDTNNWPPNHRTVPATIIAQGDEGDEITVAATATSSDASMDPDDFAFGGPGAGTTRVEASMTTVRERSGNTAHVGDNSGRMYTIHVTATFDGSSCTADFCTRTPHDMRRENREWVPCQSQYPSET
jgi:hypothetical protein